MPKVFVINFNWQREKIANVAKENQISLENGDY